MLLQLHEQVRKYPPLGWTVGAVQVMEVIAAYKDSMLPRTVFAGAVPNNWELPLADLVAELYKDAAAAAERARLAAESYDSADERR